MTTGAKTEEIRFEGLQKTNLGPVGQDDDIELFQNGVVGGSISDEFKKAQRFSDLLDRDNE